MAKILVIDDEWLIRDILVRHSEKMGHEAMAADTLSKGIELVTNSPFDLVFLDVRLPDGNGLDALPRI
ncbi:response regulator, partial [Thermodesulfobacteriota bacterium]